MHSIVRLLSSIVMIMSLAFVELTGARHGLAQDRSRDVVRVQYAIVLADSDPVHGNIACASANRCILFEQRQPALSVTLTIAGTGASPSNRLEIRCEHGCSFLDGGSQVEFCDERAFDIFAGTRAWKGCWC